MGCIQDAFADHSFDWVYLLEKKRWEPLRRLFEIRAETAKQQHKESGNLPIHEMLKYPDMPFDIVQLCFNNYTGAALIENSVGELPFVIAIHNKLEVKRLQMIIEANPAQVCSQRCEAVNELPLHMLLKRQKPINMVLFELILKSFRDATKQTDISGLIPLQLACKMNTNKKIIIALSQAYPAGAAKTLPGFKSLVQWAFKTIKNLQDQVEVISALIRADPTSASYVDKQGNLPIHYICERENTPLDFIRTVFRAYPRCLSIKDKDGNTPLHSAVETLSGNTVEQVVNMFLDESTKCATIEDKDGNMALHSACECDKPSSKVILRLIQANPKALEKRDKEKNLPLHSALELGDVIEPDVIKVMIDTYPGAVKIKDKEKNTPLHSAVEYMQKYAPVVVDMLLKADPGKYAIKQRDTEGNLAIHSA